MAYCTLNDLKENMAESSIRELTDDEASGAINQGRVSAAIAQADATIDSFLRGRYTVPRTGSIPAVINNLSVELTIWTLYTRRSELDVSDTLKTRHRDAMRALEMLQAGKVQIGVTQLSGGSDIRSNKTADDRTFGSDVLSGF